MIQNFKLTIEYDGTRFFGWQRQVDKSTIQGELELVLSRILNQPIKLDGSGRTDAGVHAWGQVASFCADTVMNPRLLQKGVNSLMKLPIVLTECIQVPENFHARFSAVSKEYHYHILNRADPCALCRDYVWHIHDLLDTAVMNLCCSLLCGTHDFRSFENTGAPRRSTVRTVFAAQVEKQPGNCLVCKICADGFLKNMARNIVGTLVDAGRHKITVKDFENIISAKDRSLAGATAPAKGLFLKQVNYA